LITDPFDVAAKEQGEYLVAEVLKHRGDFRRKTSLEFFVRFAGYDDSYNLWLPWTNMYKVEALHQYLYDQKLYALVPLEFRREDHDTLMRQLRLERVVQQQQRQPQQQRRQRR
jgi:hypothetical protein